MKQNNNIKLNEWINSEKGKFSYKIYWPFSDGFNPDKVIVEVYARLEGDSKRYVGTFLTLEELNNWFDRFKQNGEYSNGAYIPLGRDNPELLLKKVSHQAVEKTLEDLLKKDEFQKYFEKAE